MRISDWNKKHAMNVIEDFIADHKSDEWYNEAWLDPEKYDKRFLNKPYDAKIAFNYALPAGVMIGKPENQWIYRVEFLYVKPEFRALGVGKRLKEAIENEAYDGKYEEIRSYVSKDNAAAIKLNEKAEWNKQELEDCFDFYKRLK